MKALRDLSLHDCARLPCIDAGLSTLTTLAGVSMLNLQVSYLHPHPCAASSRRTAHCTFSNLSMQQSGEPRSVFLRCVPLCPLCLPAVHGCWPVPSHTADWQVRDQPAGDLIALQWPHSHWQLQYIHDAKPMQGNQEQLVSDSFCRILALALMHGHAQPALHQCQGQHADGKFKGIMIR